MLSAESILTIVLVSYIDILMQSQYGVLRRLSVMMGERYGELRFLDIPATIGRRLVSLL